MALGIRAAGAGLGVVVTLAALAGLSVMAPLPERAPDMAAPQSAVPDSAAPAPDTPPAPAALPPADTITAPVIGAAPAPDTPSAPAALPPADTVTAPVIGTAPAPDTPSAPAALPPADAITAPVIGTAPAPDTPPAAGDLPPADTITAPVIGAAQPVALPPQTLETVSLPEPDVVQGTPAIADAPPASVPAVGDTGTLALGSDTLVLPQSLPRAVLPGAGEPRDGMPQTGLLPPPAPARPEQATLVPDAPAAPLPPDMPAAPEAAPVVTPLPGRPVTGLPGQPVARTAPSDSAAQPDPALPPAAAPEPSALRRNAVLVQPEPGRPLMALVLADPGLPMADRLALAARPLPFTIALNPMDPSAPEAAAMYLENGKEVFLTASGLPNGAVASDVEVTFAAHLNAVPQAAGVIDLPRDGFTRNARLMADVLQVLAREGLGLVTFAGGLNTPERAASAAGIPQAEVFRQLDSAEESPFTIRRFLDRAVFQATQIGQVVVYGDASSPGLLQALDMWESDGRVDQVALVPVSAILLAE